MCDIASDVELPKEPDRKDRLELVGKKCMKCHNKAMYIARVKDPFCRECFLSYFIHRFRSTVGKAKVFKHGEKVLMAYSGGASSTSMLKVVQEGLADQTHKKLRFTPSVIILDEGVVHGHSSEERVQLLSERIVVALEMGFCVYFTYLEEVFGCERVWKANDILNIGEESFGVPPQAELERDKVPPPKTVSSGAHVYHTPPENVATSNEDLESHHSNSASDLEDDEWDKSNPLAVCFADEEYGHSSSRVKLKKIPPDVHVRPDTLLPSVRLSTEDVVSKCKSLPPDDKAGSKLRELFESLTTLTAKEDMLRTIRHQFLVRLAERNDFTKVLTGDNETVLAVRLLSCVSQGRGGTIPIETGFVDNRHGTVSIVRPMREFPAAEIATYCNIQRLNLVVYPIIGSMVLKDASIEKMTEDFVNGLLINFPNTVNTVFRTGDKISMSHQLSAAHVCGLCGCPLGSSASRTVAQDMKKSLLPSPKEAKKVMKEDTVSSEANLVKTRCGCQDDGCGESSCSQKGSKITAADVQNFLCYGCQLTLHDVKKNTTPEQILPQYVLQVVQRQRQRVEMKEQIKDFLLTDDLEDGI